MPDAPGAVTARENMVLKLILEGKSNAVTASGLHVSPSAIKHQVSSIFNKYGVANRAELIVKAKAAGADN